MNQNGEIVIDPNIVYDQYQTGVSETINIPSLPGSVAITTINSVTGPTIDFVSNVGGLSFTPSGTDINLDGAVTQIQESSGPTVLDIGGIADGDFLTRSGTDVIGQTVAQVLAALGIAKQNIDPANPPTINDDNTAGYSANSLWTNASNGKVYICGDATTGAAVWTNIAP